MKSSHYSTRTFWSAEDDGYIATTPELEGVSAFGETPEGALTELAAARELWLEELAVSGHEAPAPLSLPHHSGQFRLRIPRSLHGWLAARAESEGVSLNTLIVQILSEARGAHAEQPLARGART